VTLHLSVIIYHFTLHVFAAFFWHSLLCSSTNRFASYWCQWNYDIVCFNLV